VLFTSSFVEESKKKSVSEEEALKKSLQAEKRKRQKEEQMVEQKDAILRKYASAISAKIEKQADSMSEIQKPEKERPISEISYVSSSSGSFLSFAPNVEIPSYLRLKEGEKR
jgi:hypothetical protein